MSSFLCSDYHFQVIADVLAEAATNSIHPFNWSATRFLEEVTTGGESIYDVETAAVRGANKLYELNEIALFGRYKETPTERRPIQRIKYSAVNMTPEAQYKALTCLRYQCTEDEADETQVYKHLCDLCASMAEAIVSRTPAYDRAEWGIDAPAASAFARAA